MTGSKFGKKVFTQAQVRTAVDKLTEDILKKTRESKAEWALVGIQRRGVSLAKRLSLSLGERGGESPAVGTLDITFYRDDMSDIAAHPVVHDTDIPFDISDKDIYLIDDVLYTGRTIRSALDQLMDYGRPRRVYLAVLVDRGNRELPIAPDFVGQTLVTSPKDTVEVHLEEIDGEDAVWTTTGKKSTAREVI